MNTILLLQLLGSVNSLPSRRNLDQNPLLVNSQFLVQVDNVQGFFDSGFCVETEACIDFSAYSTWHNFEDLFAEFNEQSVKCCVDFLVDGAAVRFSVVDCRFDLFGIGGFLGGGEDERRVTIQRS